MTHVGFSELRRNLATHFDRVETDRTELVVTRRDGAGPDPAVTPLWSDHAWEDDLHWQTTDRTTLRRLNELIAEAWRHPFPGIGKPEPLKGNREGWWSRRIAGEHRLVYRVAGQGAEQALAILRCRRHCDG